MEYFLIFGLGIMVGGLFVTFTKPKSEQNKKPSIK